MWEVRISLYIYIYIYIYLHIYLSVNISVNIFAWLHVHLLKLHIHKSVRVCMIYLSIYISFIQKMGLAQASESLAACTYRGLLKPWVQDAAHSFFDPEVFSKATAWNLITSNVTWRLQKRSTCRLNATSNLAFRISPKHSRRSTKPVQVQSPAASECAAAPNELVDHGLLLQRLLLFSRCKQ